MAKAILFPPEPERGKGLSGAGGAARGEGAVWNTRDPSARPLSGQGVSYKSKTKSSAAQRESEGAVVLKTAGTNKPVRGKGPCLGRVGEAGKREGMTGKPGSNHPGGRRPTDKVRELQRRLWVSAKREPKRRFHALMDRIWRSDVLQEAWRRVKKNRGAAGVDRETLAGIEQQGVECFLEALGAELREGEYRPKPVLRRYILKSDGKSERPLGIPAVRDRVVQMAAKLVLEPIFEADFRESSYGFRPQRGTLQALERIRKLGAEGYNHVLDGDIRDYFGSIDRRKLMLLVEQRISDRRVLKLLRQWLEAGVMEEGEVRNPQAGTPQGGVISPLLSNIYLHVLDRIWEDRYAHLGVLVRYADDLVILCRTRAACEEAEQRVRGVLARLGLELHPEKTRKVDLSWGKEGFDFLGCHLHKRLSGRIWEQQRKKRYYLQRWPSKRAMKRVRQRIKELTPRSRCHVDIREIIARINPVLRGWGNYFSTGNAAIKFQQIDRYVWGRLRSLRVKRKGRNLKPGESKRWSEDYFHALGLYRLRGTVRYPEQA
jgi:RNA-directed DNA polymerase